MLLDYRKVVAASLAIILVGGYLWSLYGEVIELMFDVGTIKIVISYLMVTGSVNSSVNVEMPPALQRISTVLKFDTSGVMKWLLKSASNNVLLMCC